MTDGLSYYYLMFFYRGTAQTESRAESQCQSCVFFPLWRRIPNSISGKQQGGSCLPSLYISLNFSPPGLFLGSFGDSLDSSGLPLRLHWIRHFSPGVTPGVTPGGTPGVTPGVIPGMNPAVTLGVTPSVIPGVTLGVTPGVIPV